ncbi:protein of unknown function [Chryseobacterium sp. JV274]|nr:protein of unknown function [Chryseobacterium sp. JV274]
MSGPSLSLQEDKVNPTKTIKTVIKNRGTVNLFIALLFSLNINYFRVLIYINPTFQKSCIYF